MWKLRFTKFIVTSLSFFIVFSFFMPWVSGKGSLFEPLDKSTRIIQKIDKTGAIKGLVKATKKLVDIFTIVVARKKLKRTLRGFEIPLMMSKTEGWRVYLLYLIPVTALFFCLFIEREKPRSYFDLIVTFLSWGWFIILYRQSRFFNQDQLFVNIQEEWGFRSTVYAFLAVGIFGLIRFMIRVMKKRITVSERMG